MKILIIAEWFYPASEIAAVRSTMLYKYWKRAGHEVKVVVMDKCLNNPEKIDNNKICEADVFRVNAATWLDKWYLKYRTENISASKEKQARIRKISSLKKFAMYKIIAYYFKQKQKKWEKNCRQLLMTLNCDFDVVFSTYSPVEALNLGEFIKRSSRVKKWIADFRDPPLKPASSTPVYVKPKWIKKICKRADLITCVSKGVLKELFLPNALHNKACIITNGFDLEALNDIVIELPIDKFTFVYTGTVYINDNFDCFFKVIYDLINEGEIDKGRVKLNYAGRDVQILLEQAGRYGLESIIVYHGLVSREESLKIQLNSHVMLYTTWNTRKRQGILKGKIFEQMMMNKPVLGFIDGEIKNSESKEIFDKTQIGFCYEYAVDSYEELKQYVLDLYNQWTKKGEISYTRNQDEVDKYNYKNIAAKLLEEIK